MGHTSRRPLKLGYVATLSVTVALLSVSLATPARAFQSADRHDVQIDCPRDAATSEATACAGVRPGAVIDVEKGFLCTMNFLFRGSDGHDYIGTAGHCIEDGEDAEGIKVWKPGKGRDAYDGDGERIGETAYWALRLGQLDFGLIRLDRDVEASPQMCEFGGPTGIYTGFDQTPATLDFFSDASDIGTVMPGRTLLAATGFPGKYTIDAIGAALFGDSGAPAILQDGRAAGVLTGGGAGWSDPPAFSAGNVFLVRIDHQLKVAERALGIDLELMTAPQS